MMKTPARLNARISSWFVGAVLVTALAGIAGCARKEKDVPRASSSLDGGRIVVAGVRPKFPAAAVPVTEGFLESARWDESIHTLQCKGWAPLDVRPDTVRFVLRDPFDQLQLEGTPLFTPQDRADVAAAFPTRPGLLHAGFTASIRLTNVPEHDTWIDTLELYCLDPTGACFRLSRIPAPTRQSWDRRPDRFEIALTYLTPVLTVAEKKHGSLDVCEPGSIAGTMRLAGWASFDGESPRSAMIVQLAPSLAPAAIVTAAWLPRPDVRAAVDPQRADLDRCGFELVLRVPGSIDDLRADDALRLWSIDSTNNAVQLGLPALRTKR